MSPTRIRRIHVGDPTRVHTANGNKSPDKGRGEIVTAVFLRSPGPTAKLNSQTSAAPLAISQRSLVRSLAHSLHRLTGAVFLPRTCFATTSVREKRNSEFYRVADLIERAKGKRSAQCRALSILSGNREFHVRTVRTIGELFVAISPATNKNLIGTHT